MSDAPFSSPAGARSAGRLATWVALWIATVGNLPLWKALWALPETQSSQGLLFIGAFSLIVFGLLSLLMQLLAWPRLVKVVATVFLVSAAFGAYFMLTYGIVIDPTMMRNVVQTDAREVRDLLSWRMLLIVGGIAGLPLLWLWRQPVRRIGFWRQAGRNGLWALASLLLVAGALVSSYAPMSATMRNHKSLRYLINPLNAYYALGAMVRDANARPAGPPQVIGEQARLQPLPAGGRPPLMVFVVGETARASQFSLNGYARPTNPELSRLGVVSFTDVTSCGTNTAASVPCMFSHLGREGYVSRDGDFENLLDLAQRAGLAVLWLDNQAGCKGVCDRVPHDGAGNLAPGAPPMPAGMCKPDGECFDTALLHGLDERLAALPAERRARGVLIVMHQMGSHGPAYYLRSPDDRKPYLPECTTNVLQSCPREQVVNAYDNTIAYTDHVLAGVIGWLGRQGGQFDPSLLYVSDHGESLGENNLYLHGLPYAVAPREQKHVPWVAWWPQDRGPVRGIDLACLAQRRDAPLTHDHLFHTVARWFGIESPEVRAELDAYQPCRAAKAP